ncbi:demethylmenaquinone methyltransferase [bacterium BMS3Abin10]|nr:demethylmenaquinone methyltransferase [bacterium BMS3Abin10]GBE38024.1 demethylmenaquinone methyltransferase [bacterium BMS3Bbin08]
MSKPAKNPAKIQTMFSSIAPRYDLLNRLLSLGRDRYWRQFAVSRLPKKQASQFLDVATGTGDVAVEIIKQHGPDTRITGIDFSEGMLELGKKKISDLGYQQLIDLRRGDVTSLDFEDEVFDAAIIAFGIRNVPDYKKSIMEMARVIKKGGRVVILEFTSMQSRFFQWIFRLYLEKILPFLGGLISGRKTAYKYLSDSVMDFPPPEEFKKIMLDSGLKEVEYHRLTFSIVTVHVGIK